MEYAEGARRLEPVEFVNTDDRRQYRIPGLRAGRYYLKASYSDRWATAGVVIRPAEGTTPQEGYPSLYYPGVSDPTRAMEIRLQDGEDRNGIDITIVPTRTVVIRGRVVTAAAQQGANEASVFLTPRMTGGLALLERVPVHINARQQDLMGDQPCCSPIEQNAGPIGSRPIGNRSRARRFRGKPVCPKAVPARSS